MSRSLYTPFVFTRGNRATGIYPQLMDEIKQAYNTKVVLCQAQLNIVQSRLQERYDKSSEEEKVIRRNLGETSVDFIRGTDSRYNELLAKGFFELAFDTSEGSVEELADKLLQKVDSKH